MKTKLSILLTIVVLACFALPGMGSNPANLMASQQSQVSKDSAIDSSDCDWPMFGRTPDGNRVAPDGCGPKTDSLELKWKFKTQVIESPPSILNDKLYFGSRDRNLYCLNIETTQEVWKYETDNQILSSPAISNSKVYFGSGDKIYCLNAENGLEIWIYKIDNAIGSSIRSSLLVSNSKVYFGSDSKIYCLNAENGKEIWEYMTGNIISSSPAISNGKVYIGSFDNKMYCLNAESGQMIWEYLTGDDVYSSPTVSNSKVYFGSDDTKFYCLNAENGKEIWEYKTGGRISSSPSVSKSKVYFGSDDNNFYCLNAENGKEIWEYKTGGNINSSPAISNGKVYIGSMDSILYCFSANNGLIIWAYETDHLIDCPPVISKGKVYIYTYYGFLYCFGDTVNTLKTTIYAKGHTKQEIVLTYKSKYSPSYKGDIFEIKPVTSNPYKIGKLKKEYLLEGLNELNFLRYLAGVPETKLDEAACEEAQNGAFLMAVLKKMTHYPECPGGLPMEICMKGKNACSSGNISMGGSDSLRDKVSAWVDDTFNVSGTNPGHRRWIFYPELCQTGFGVVDNFALMKVFNFDTECTSNLVNYEGIVCWPAPGSFPKKHFNPYMTWSVSIDLDRVELKQASKNLVVTLIRKSDNKKWVFNTSTPSEGKSYYYINTVGYGTPYCINFRPNPDELGTINDNESFSVNISGFKDNFGNKVDISYEINLFDLDKALVSDIKYECTDCIKYMQFQIDSSNWNICDLQQPMMTTAPKIINGRTFLVVKYIAETVGANVSWNEKEKNVTIFSPETNKTIHLWIGKNTAEINGKMIPIDPDNNKVVPLILNGRTMLPLRFVGESLGLNVEWEAATRRATILFKPIICNE